MKIAAAYDDRRELRAFLRGLYEADNTLHLEQLHVEEPTHDHLGCIEAIVTFDNLLEQLRLAATAYNRGQADVEGLRKADQR